MSYQELYETTYLKQIMEDTGLTNANRNAYYSLVQSAYRSADDIKTGEGVAAAVNTTKKIPGIAWAGIMMLILGSLYVVEQGNKSIVQELNITKDGWGKPVFEKLQNQASDLKVYWHWEGANLVLTWNDSGMTFQILSISAKKQSFPCVSISGFSFISKMLRYECMGYVIDADENSCKILCPTSIQQLPTITEPVVTVTRQGEEMFLQCGDKNWKLEKR